EPELIGSVCVADTSALDFKESGAVRELGHERAIASFVILPICQEDKHTDIPLALCELATGRRKPLRELCAAVVLGPGKRLQSSGLIFLAGPRGRGENVGCASSDDDKKLAIFGQFSDGFNERLFRASPFLS